MEPEVIAERVKELLHNNPADNIDKLPKDIEEAISKVIMERAEKFAPYLMEVPSEQVIAGAIGQAFFAGHEYAVKYGNLNAEMGGNNETISSTDSE